MNDRFAITRADMLAEVTRELAMRRRVYPGWIKRGQLTAGVAERRIAVLEAVRAWLFSAPEEGDTR